jgi:peptide deformylase
MILKIRSVGEPVLRSRAKLLRPAEIQLPSTRDLIAAMRETMQDAPGVGLAAPQVGVSLQLAVIEDRQENMKDLSREVLAERERKPVPFHQPCADP